MLCRCTRGPPPPRQARGAGIGPVCLGLVYAPCVAAGLQVEATLTLASGAEYVATYELFAGVDPASATIAYRPTKVEVKVKKVVSAMWPTLERPPAGAPVGLAPVAATAAAPAAAPAAASVPSTGAAHTVGVRAGRHPNPQPPAPATRRPGLPSAHP